MGYTYYKHMVMIPDNVELDINDVLSLLEEKFTRNDSVTVEKPTAYSIVVKRNKWTYELRLSEEAHVLEESAEIANIFGKDRADKDVIASVKRRIDSFGADDPNMDYFNDYISVLEALETIAGVYHFQADEGELWKTGER